MGGVGIIALGWLHLHALCCGHGVQPYWRTVLRNRGEWQASGMASHLGGKAFSWQRGSHAIRPLLAGSAQPPTLDGMSHQMDRPQSPGLHGP
jgi:hypothetical protein